MGNGQGIPPQAIIGLNVQCKVSGEGAGLHSNTILRISLEWPGMGGPAILDVPARAGEDTKDIADNVAEALRRHGGLAGNQHNIRVDWDGGPRGDAYARILIRCATHVNFGVARGGGLHPGSLRHTNIMIGKPPGMKVEEPPQPRGPVKFDATGTETRAEDDERKIRPPGVSVAYYLLDWPRPGRPLLGHGEWWAIKDAPLE